MNSKGALIFAQNNSAIDYIKLSIFAAERVKRFLHVPVSIATDNRSWLLETYPNHPFDQIIDLPAEPSNHKLFYDGTIVANKLEWKNLSRFRAYDISPYDKTLVIDSDYIINSSVLTTAFERAAPFQIYQKSMDLAGWRNTDCFKRMNCYSIPFYWATAFVFEKSSITRAFFDLVSYVKQNWLYFRVLYSIDATAYRNDFAFSIAIHLMNGKIDGGFALELPGTMTYVLDRDICVNICDTSIQFLVEKQAHLGEYIAVKTQGIDVHIMNKYSLSRILNGGQGV